MFLKSCLLAAIGLVVTSAADAPVLPSYVIPSDPVTMCTFTLTRYDTADCTGSYYYHYTAGGSTLFPIGECSTSPATYGYITHACSSTYLALSGGVPCGYGSTYTAWSFIPGRCQPMWYLGDTL